MRVVIMFEPVRGLITEAAGASKSEVQLHKRLSCAVGLLMGSWSSEKSLLSGETPSRGVFECQAIDSDL